jgi:hypothetical protein
VPDFTLYSRSERNFPIKAGLHLIQYSIHILSTGKLISIPFLSVSFFPDTFQKRCNMKR